MIDKEYNELQTILNSYMSKENINEVNNFYKKALELYKDNEENFKHSLRVAKILALLSMDTTTICSSLIHDVITNNFMTYEEVKEEFGEEKATILNSISKISQIRKTYGNKFTDTDKYRRIVVGLSENPISLFIKLADRLDNLRNIKSKSEEDIKYMVDSTEKIYIPIAHRLGIKSIKSEMEDLCLQIQNPKLYNEVLEKINSSKEELTESLYKMRDELIKLLNEHEIKFEITYRVKSVRGIYNKLMTGRKWDDIYDLLGLRILLEKTEECYLVVGLIHSKFRPIPKRFKDYIANPKNNMYQSLHTSVFGVNGKIYEVQIRTYEMNDIAEHGVASHWSYKEHTDGSKTNKLEEKLAQFRTLIEANDIENNEEFFKDLGKTISKEFIYVFTPKGDIIELPVDSTPIDFAYKIHSEVGNTTEGAIVNGKMVPLDYALQDGDIVDLKTSKNRTPSKSWLKFVKTEGAKSRIRSYFYKKEKEKTIETGKELLLIELKKKKVSISEFESLIEEVLKYYKTETIEELYASIATYKYSPLMVTNYIYDLLNPKKDEYVDKLLTNENKIEKDSNGKILIGGYADILTNLANCCNPIPGDSIVGFITKGKGITIHRKDCKYITESNERIIDASWNTNNTDKYITSIRIYVSSTNDRLVDIISIATKNDINITSINNKGNDNDDDIYELVCKVKNIEVLNKFINDLSMLSYISKVER